MTEHPMQPPPEQIDTWIDEVLTPRKPGRQSVHRDHAYGCCIHVARQAYAAGAIEMMHSICAWLDQPSQMASSLINPLLERFGPEPKSLKLQAMDILNFGGHPMPDRLELSPDEVAIIHSALEALPDD